MHLNGSILNKKSAGKPCLLVLISEANNLKKLLKFQINALVISSLYCPQKASYGLI